MRMLRNGYLYVRVRYLYSMRLPRSRRTLKYLLRAMRPRGTTEEVPLLRRQAPEAIRVPALLPLEARGILEGEVMARRKKGGHSMPAWRKWTKTAINLLF